jgi:hypothetical protein
VSESKKKTGLGKSAFFASTTGEDNSPTLDDTSTKQETRQPEKPKKVRTTITLYPETLMAMELLKAHGRKTGDKITLSDVFAEAIGELMRKKGISIQ